MILPCLLANAGGLNIMHASHQQVSVVVMGLFVLILVLFKHHLMHEFFVSAYVFCYLTGFIISLQFQQLLRQRDSHYKIPSQLLIQIMCGAEVLGYPTRQSSAQLDSSR